MKTVEHEPHEKLMDCLVSILVGCRSLGQSNLRLRPDEVLAAAWGRRRFAEQSTLWDTLDALTGENVAQLRAALPTIYRREAKAPRATRRPAAADGGCRLKRLTSLPAS